MTDYRDDPWGKVRMLPSEAVMLAVYRSKFTEPRLPWWRRLGRWFMEGSRPVAELHG